MKSVSWGGAKTKGELKSVSSSLTQLFFTIKKLAMRTNGIKNRVLLTNHIELYARLTYVEPYQNILEHFCTKMHLLRLV